MSIPTHASQLYLRTLVGDVTPVKLVCSGADAAQLLTFTCPGGADFGAAAVDTTGQLSADNVIFKDAVDAPVNLRTATAAISASITDEIADRIADVLA